MKTLFQLKSELSEKHLTPAEMKKREEIAKAIHRETPGMPMGKKMAIATAQAKKVSENVGDLDEASSPTAGTRLVKKYGDEANRAEVRHNAEWGEYQVHHYKDGKHMGEGPVSYHGDDKQDAHDTAKHEAEKRSVKSESLEDTHLCAKHVYSNVHGEGVVLESMHADPDNQGNIEWYIVEFANGPRKVFTEKLQVMVAEFHSNHKKKKVMS